MGVRVGLRRQVWKLKQRIRVIEDKVSALEVGTDVDAIGFRFEPLTEGEENGDSDGAEEFN